MEFLPRLFSLASRPYSLSTKFPAGMGPGSILAAKLGVPRTPLPDLSLASTAPKQKPASNITLLRHLSAILTKKGQRGEPIVASVNAQLQARYGVSDPIRVAIDAVKPVIKYYKSKKTRRFLPLALFPKTADSMALRWLIENANAKTYTGGRPNIVRALVDELDSVIQGNSSLFMKKFNTHRNPN